jgi:hypothetical protein
MLFTYVLFSQNDLNYNKINNKVTFWGKQLLYDFIIAQSFYIAL